MIGAKPLKKRGFTQSIFFTIKQIVEIKALLTPHFNRTCQVNDVINNTFELCINTLRRNEFAN